MIPWSYLFSNLKQRPLRTILTILSVAGAVAAVVSVLQATAATQIQLQTIHTSFDSPVAMEVVAADTSPFSADDAGDLARQPGIASVIPVFRIFTKVVADGKDARCLTTGTEIEEYRAIRSFSLLAGQMATLPGEVSLEASVAEYLGVAPGADIKIGARGFPWLLPMKVTGIFKLSAVDSVEETSAVITSLADAAKLGRTPGKVNALQIVLHNGANEADVAEEIRSKLPAHLIVTKSTSAGDLSRPTQAMIGIGLNVAALLSLVAAVFIVFNSFQMSVAERQRQVALMRILGATVEQVRMSHYREAAFLGGVGTLLGIVPGVLGSQSLTHSMLEVMGFSNLLSVGTQPHAVAAGLLFGPLVTMFSVWYPAHAACDTEPLAILKFNIPRRSRFSRKAAVVAGILSLLTAGIMFATASFGINADTTCLIAISSLEVGAAFLLPELIKPCLNFYYRTLSVFFPVEAQLGQRQLVENFDRTALTVAVLFVVSAASVSVGNTTASLTGNIQLWMERTVTADYLLFASRPTIDMSDAEPLPEALAGRLKNIPGIKMIDEVTFTRASVNGRASLLAVQMFDGYETLPIDLIEGREHDLTERLRSGGALLGSVLANLLHVKCGDTVSVEVSGATQTVEVVGIIREYTAGGLMLQMDAHAAGECFPLPVAQAWGIRVEDDARSVVGAELKKVAREYGLIFQSLSDLQELVQNMVSGITNRLFLILIVALVIAAFAIVNSQTMNVIEQSRHLGMLRIVGMLQSQAFRMFLFQSLILGLLGILPGILLGILMSFLTILSFQGITDHGIAFVADVRLLAAYLVCGLFLSLMAAALPALRAARMRPLEAIHEE